MSKVSTTLQKPEHFNRRKRELERLGVDCVPDGWSLSNVGSACSIRNELRLPISVEERSKMVGDYPYYGPTGVLGSLDDFRVEGQFALIGEDGDHFMEPSRKPQTILVSGKFNVNNHAHIVGAGPDCSIDWFFYFFHNRDISHALTRQGAGRFKLTKSALDQLPILMPPLHEQRKIAETLRTWDEAIEKLEVLCRARERRFAAAAQRLLAPSRTLGSGIPRSDWKMTTFGDVFDERQDRNAGLGPDDVVTVGKYAIRKQSEHFKRSVASKDLSNYWTISPGDFVYDPMSVYYGAIGRFDGLQDGIVSPAYRVVRLKNDISAEFMVHLLRTHHIRFLLDTRSSQGNKDGKRRLLQRHEFESLEFKLPPAKAQQEITNALLEFQRDVAVTEKQRGALKRQKRGLMQKLLTGEWRVKV